MVSECPQRLLELAASCCLVSDLVTFRVYQMDTHFLCQLCLKTNKHFEKGSKVLPLTLMQIEAFRRPSFTELQDELGEIAETLEAPHNDLTTG